MKVVSSLPNYEEFKKLLDCRLEEVKEGFDKDEVVISSSTYNEAMLLYDGKEREDLSKFVTDNNLSLVNPFTGGNTWTRFEEYHVPSIFKETDIKPYRRSKDTNVYYIKAVKDIKLSMLHGNYITVKTGYKLIIPADCVALVGSCNPDVAVINPVIPAASLKGEFYVNLMHTTSEYTEIKRGEDYIYVAIVKAETLMSDNVFKDKNTLEF